MRRRDIFKALVLLPVAGSVLKSVAESSIEPEQSGDMVSGVYDPHDYKWEHSRQFGLRSWIEDGHEAQYDGNIDDFIEQIQKLWFDRIPTQDRKVTLIVTEDGLKLFDNYVRKQYEYV